MKPFACVAIALIALSACGTSDKEMTEEEVTEFHPYINSQDPFCATAEEAIALDTRAMQSELMNAALSCNQQSLYNNFVTKHKGELGKQHSRVEEYFKRLHGGNAKRQLNTFMTNLANTASQTSMQMDGKIFCQDSAAAFNEVLNGGELYAIATQPQFIAMHGIPRCS